jgi:hypothetical protein
MATKRRPPAKNSGRPQRGKTQVGWRKRPITWAAGLISTLILAIVAAIGTGIGSTLFTAINHNAPTGRPGGRVSAPSTGLPVKIEQVTPLNTGPNNSFAVPVKLQLTAAQLTMLNQGNAHYLAAFQAANRAVPTDNGFTSITVMGNSTKTVTVTGMQVIKQCQAPVTGTYFYNPPAGEDTTISLGFDLDSQITYAQDTRAGTEYSGNFFQEHVVTLAPGEPQTFTVYVKTTQHYCRFSFRMTVATAQGVITEKIPTDGEPFELTASADQKLNTADNRMNVSSYRAVYVGGVADFQNNDAWMQVNPKTYNGVGNPASFPPTNSKP